MHHDKQLSVQTPFWHLRCVQEVTKPQSDDQLYNHLVNIVAMSLAGGETWSAANPAIYAAKSLKGKEREIIHASLGMHTPVSAKIRVIKVLAAVLCQATAEDLVTACDYADDDEVFSPELTSLIWDQPAKMQEVFIFMMEQICLEKDYYQAQLKTIINRGYDG